MYFYVILSRPIINIIAIITNMSEPSPHHPNNKLQPGTVYQFHEDFRRHPLFTLSAAIKD